MNIREVNNLSNENVILIDGMNLFHRVYNRFIMLKNSNGVRTGAVYGFLNSMLYFVNQFKSNHIIIAFEGKGENIRKSFMAGYKSHRGDKFTEQQKKEFNDSLIMVIDMLDMLGVIYIEKEKYEADDVMWYISKVIFKNNVIIVSNDKDLLQLVSNKHKRFIYRTNGDGYDIADIKYVKEKFGINPNDIKYYLALCGDRGDEVPGVKGIGTVGAKSLINKFYGIVNKNKEIMNCLNVNQKQEYIQSYKAVALGKLNNNLKLYSRNIHCGDFNKSEIDFKLKKYEIKKFRTDNLKILHNKKFIKLTKNLIIKGM